MPATLVPIRAQRDGTYVLVEAFLPERPPQTIGVFLMDSAADRSWVRLRPSFQDQADPDDAEILEALEHDMRERAQEMGAEAYLSWLEDWASNVVRVSERRTVPVDSFTRALEQLYDTHIEPVEKKPFEIHLPLYILRAAAGKLGEEMQSEPEGWVPAPQGMHLDPNLFVAHVVGESMEPRIPDGSLNRFRFHPVGSRRGKFLLIERFGVLDETARYTVKRYTSRKKEIGEDEWRHEEILLEPLNPKFEPWPVEPHDFAVVAEWLRVIE
jgi:SOS-response transcriptional repressor LexA